MAKYSLESRKKVVDYVLMEHHSTTEAAREFSVEVTQVKQWVRKYNRFGTEGLVKKLGTYTGDFKKHVIEYMHANQLSIRETSIYFGIPSDTTVGKWERIYYEEGPVALYCDNRGRKNNCMSLNKPKKELPKSTEEDLIAEVQRLRMENDYLKKLIALAQEREEKKKKKK